MEDKMIKLDENVQKNERRYKMDDQIKRPLYERYGNLVRDISGYITEASSYENVVQGDWAGNSDPLKIVRGKCWVSFSELEGICKKLEISTPFRE